MKLILKYRTIILTLLIVSAIFSCKKEKSCENCNGNPSRSTNKLPIAKAGPDQVIILPTDSILLDGSASNDPDGTITNWLWTNISGAAPVNISNSTSAISKVKIFTVGVYKFELSVKDNSGLTTKDTVQVLVNPGTGANRPPIANAGADQLITLPANAVTLDGSASTDPDNNFIGYSWAKISGPSLFSISNPTSTQPQLTNLVEGVYQFELTVTDFFGLFSKDTAMVIVNTITSGSCVPLNRPLISAQLIQVGYLSVARAGMASVSAGNKIFFAGGYNASGMSSRVDVYDVATNQWTTAELSIPRSDISAIASGDKVFFAGGYTSSSNRSARIDIYNTSTQTWSTAELSQARNIIVTATVGSKVFFAGGYTGNGASGNIDIYDASINLWSIATLSETRRDFTATTAGNKIYFAGGWNGIDGSVASTKIDIYDNATNSWTISSMSSPKAYFASFYKNGKIYWAGGADYIDWANDITLKCEVEIRDVNTQLSTFTNLSQPNWLFNAYEMDNKIVLPIVSWWNQLQRFDIYDMSANNWSIAVLNQLLDYHYTTFISKNNIIYITGGFRDNGGNGGLYTSQVWKLDF